VTRRSRLGRIASRASWALEGIDPARVDLARVRVAGIAFGGDVNPTTSTREQPKLSGRTAQEPRFIPGRIPLLVGNGAPNAGFA
jgi:hypothetical protein